MTLDVQAIHYMLLSSFLPRTYSNNDRRDLVRSSIFFIAGLEFVNLLCQILYFCHENMAGLRLTKPSTGEVPIIEPRQEIARLRRQILRSSRVMTYELL